MDGKMDLFQDIEKIKALSQFMGQGEFPEEDLKKTVEMAKTLAAVMEFSQNSKPQEETIPLETAAVAEDNLNIYARNRKENAIHAAIPFLDQGYQKDLCIAVRLLEINRIMSVDGKIESRSRKEDNPKTRRRSMLQALRPYLQQGERQKVDMMIKTMDVKHIMEWTEEKE